MTRIRQWLVSIALVAALMLSFAPVASADPGDPGKKISRALVDPGDPGTGY